MPNVLVKVDDAEDRVEAPKLVRHGVNEFEQAHSKANALVPLRSKGMLCTRPSVA